MPDEKLAEMFIPVLEKNGIDTKKFSKEYIARAAGMVKGRINFVQDLWNNAAFFFVEPESYDEKAVKKRWSPEMPEILGKLTELLEKFEDFTSPEIEPAVLAWIEQNGYHLGNVMNAFRLTVVGECKGPHMFDITALLGKEETLKRIRKGIERISLPKE